MGTTTMISSAPSQVARPSSGDFVADVADMADLIDRRLRLSLTPKQYAMVQDLVLATRIATIARDAAEECAESSAA